MICKWVGHNQINGPLYAEERFLQYIMAVSYTHLTYSVLNTKSAFPYAVKVEGYGNTRNQRSLFQFAHVTITEHMVNAKYGTRCV